MDRCGFLLALVTAAGCTSSHSGAAGDGGAKTGDASTADAATIDSGVPGTPITCPGPGNPTSNGGSCGTERWDIKTGTDTHAPAINLTPQPNAIAALVALPAAGAGSNRETPTETTLWQLTNVTLTELKEETDSDYHLVISDGANTMIAEIPYPTCATGSPWTCFMSRARSEIDSMYTVTSSPQYPAATITLRGIGFFDYLHGQNGVAPNAIELHPVLQICFGKDCTPS